MENDSDFNVLSALAKRTERPLRDWLTAPYYVPLKGSHPQDAKRHFFALQAIHSDMRGALLLDGDHRGLPEHEVAANGLEVIRWKRYEIENYLVHPGALHRFIEQWAGPLVAEIAIKQLEQILPPAIMKDPLADHNYLEAAPASKSILPDVFAAAALAFPKQDYYQIVEIMAPEEIHPEVTEKLNLIADALGVS